MSNVLSGHIFYFLTALRLSLHTPDELFYVRPKNGGLNQLNSETDTEDIGQLHAAIISTSIIRNRCG